jgi:hypothetical protein
MVQRHNQLATADEGRGADKGATTTWWPAFAPRTRPASILVEAYSQTQQQDHEGYRIMQDTGEYGTKCHKAAEWNRLTAPQPLQTRHDIAHMLYHY